MSKIVDLVNYNFSRDDDLKDVVLINLNELSEIYLFQQMIQYLTSKYESSHNTNDDNGLVSFTMNNDSCYIMPIMINDFIENIRSLFDIKDKDNLFVTISSDTSDDSIIKENTTSIIAFFKRLDQMIERKRQYRLICDEIIKNESYWNTQGFYSSK